jgi:glycine amidinotransferase
LKIWTDNDWKIIEAPRTSAPGSYLGNFSDLSLNFLSLSTKQILMEEGDIELYRVLEDLGFDLITCQLKAINEYGGSIHCSTIDIRRQDSCKDYFPIQDYEKECEIDYTKPFPHTFIEDLSQVPGIVRCGSQTRL